MMAHVAYNTAKKFLATWVNEDVIKTIEDSCDLSHGVTIKRLNRSYDGLHDTIIVRFDTLKGNQFEIEFVYDITLRL